MKYREEYLKGSYVYPGESGRDSGKGGKGQREQEAQDGCRRSLLSVEVTGAGRLESG